MKSVKVAGRAKSLPRPERTIPELVINSDYYVCFTGSIVRKCILLEVNKTGEQKNWEATIKIPDYPKKGAYTKNVVYVDEIGRTPEQAVENTVR